MDVVTCQIAHWTRRSLYRRARARRPARPPTAEPAMWPAMADEVALAAPALEEDMLGA